MIRDNLSDFFLTDHGDNTRMVLCRVKFEDLQMQLEINLDFLKLWRQARYINF